MCSLEAYRFADHVSTWAMTLVGKITEENEFRNAYEEVVVKTREWAVELYLRNPEKIVGMADNDNLPEDLQQQLKELFVK